VFTFSDGYAYVGLAQDPKVRYRQHTTPQKKLSPVYKHIQKTGAVFEFKILTDWLHKDIAGKVEDDYIKRYAADGWKMLNTNKGGSLGGSTNLYPHERIVQEVAKYEYVDDFMKGSPGFYHYIHNHHLTDVFFANLKYKTKPHGYWTLERAIAVTSECESRKELHNRYGQAYAVLKNAGVLDDYYPNNSGKVTWTMEKSLSVIPLCKSRMELQRKYQRAYNVLLRARVLDEYFPLEWKPFTLEEKMAMIESCKSRMELRGKHRTVYDWAIKNGLLDKYFPLKAKERTYEERLQIIASCKSRMELRDKYDSVYKWGLKNNLLDKYFPLKHRNFTVDERLSILSGCKSRKDLRREHNSVYKWALKNGLIEQYFHLQPKGV
jgi:hypothetical protein